MRAGLASLVAGASAGLAPAEAEDGARRAARLGLDLPQLLQTYRVGHAVAWDHVLAQIEALDPDDDIRSEMLRLASRHLFAYVDAVVPLVTEVYTRERDALLRSGEHRRRRLLRDVLDGSRTDADELVARHQMYAYLDLRPSSSWRARLRLLIASPRVALALHKNQRQPKSA